MKYTRGEFLGAAATAVGALSLSGCSVATRYLSRPEIHGKVGTVDLAAGGPVWRALNRMSFGPRPGDVERVQAMGIDAYVEEQLAPERIHETDAAWMRLLPLDTLDMDAGDAEDFDQATYSDYGKGQASLELQQACVLRATYSARQLEQVMVDFWTDHFNITQLKGECSWLKTVDDRLIRKHVLGKFRDLVTASAHSPAMLFYLDNDKNQKRDNHGSGANENYARELLELHTLGVHGGYTLHDIQEVARCFTGWSYKKGLWKKWPGDFVFQVERHDAGPKTVLGVRIPPRSGEEGRHDGEQVIDIVCRHPSTAHFIAQKLCRRFVADRGPEPLIRRLAEVFQKTDGDISQVLSELFHSEEFRNGDYRKLKRPFDFAVSSLRALNADTTGRGILSYLEQMGQLPFKWTMPDGYPDRVAAWTPSLLARWNFSLDLVRGKIDQTGVDWSQLVKATGQTEPLEIARGLSRMVHGRALPEAALVRAVNELDSPDGQEKSIQQFLALLLAAPEFQWR